MSEQRFWYGVDGERHGPVSLEEIHEMVRAGRLKPTDYIWNEEHQVWTRVTDFLGAMGESTPPPPGGGSGFGVPGGTTEPGDQDAGFAGPGGQDAGFDSPDGGADWGSDAGQRFGGTYVNQNPSYADQWEGPREYAGFWVRVGAHIIDAFILGAIGMVWFFIAAALGMMDGWLSMDSSDPEDIYAMWDAFPFAYYMVSIIISWIYEAGFIASSWMATPGKRAMGIVVVNERGEGCGFGQASLRFIMKSIFGGVTGGLAYLVIAFTEKKQGLHDFVAQTFCEKT